jgi:hypothetical protein
MKNKQSYIILIIIVILLSECEKDVDFNGKEPSPKMVVNAIINTQSDTNRIKISESVFDYSNQQPGVVENPEIHLNINGKECNQLWPDTVEGIHTYYKFVAQLNVDDRVELSAYTPKHGTVKGYDNVPDVAEIKNIETSWFTKNGFSYLRLYVTLKDNPIERNFYRIIVKSKDDITPPSIQEPLKYWDFQEVFIDDEMVFRSATEEDDGSNSSGFYRIFTDELFQGKEYTLNLYIQYVNWLESRDDMSYVRQRIKVEIHTLSEKLYQNLHSQELASGIATGDLFSEPVKIYTNMKGGYGILGIYNITEKEKIIASKGDD